MIVLRWLSRVPRLVVAAIVLVALWGVLELAGGRSATVALAGAVRDPLALLFAIAYLASWFAAVLLAPPLVTTAIVLALLRAVQREPRAPASPEHAPRLP